MSPVSSDLTVQIVVNLNDGVSLSAFQFSVVDQGNGMPVQLGEFFESPVGFSVSKNLLGVETKSPRYWDDLFHRGWRFCKIHIYSESLPDSLF